MGSLQRALEEGGGAICKSFLFTEYLSEQIGVLGLMGAAYHGGQQVSLGLPDRICMLVCSGDMCSVIS
jgi:hypothetical protein